MKIRESGMPEEAMWADFFDVPAIVDKLGITAVDGDVAEFGCGYGTFTLAAPRCGAFFQKKETAGVQKITFREPRPDHAPAYVSNGLVGLRVGRIPLPGGAALVNGYYGLHDAERIESYQPAPYPLGADLLVGRVWLSQRPDLAVFQEQAYDFACGELHSRFEFKVDAATARVEVITFCSRTQPALALQQVSVTVDQPCHLTLRGGLDTEGLPGRCLRREAINPGWEVVDGVLHWEARGGPGSCGAAFVTKFLGDDRAQSKRNFWGHENALRKDYSVSAQPGKTYALQQLGGLVPSAMHAAPDQQAIRLTAIGKHWGFDKLREDNRKAWEEIWSRRPWSASSPRVRATVNSPGNSSPPAWAISSPSRSTCSSSSRTPSPARSRRRHRPFSRLPARSSWPACTG